MPRVPIRSPLLSLAAVMLGITLAGAAQAAWSHDPITSGLAFAPNPNVQYLSPDAPVADGNGGVFIPFVQWNGTGYDIAVQRMTAAGTPAAGWPAGGALAYTSATFTSRDAPHLVLDGSGGVIVVWKDHRSGTHWEVYAQKLNSVGAPQWALNGVLASVSSSSDKPQFAMCADGAGGAFVAYRIDLSGTDQDIHLSHLSPGGSSTIVTVAVPAGFQSDPAVCSDGLGGCYIAYDDNLGSTDRKSVV